MLTRTPVALVEPTVAVGQQQALRAAAAALPLAQPQPVGRTPIAGRRVLSSAAPAQIRAPAEIPPSPFGVPQRVAPITPGQFRSACPVETPAATVQVPQKKFILHRKPVIQETVTEEVTYMNVPVQYAFEERDYPATKVADCQRAISSCGCQI